MAIAQVLVQNSLKLELASPSAQALGVVEMNGVWVEYDPDSSSIERKICGHQVAARGREAERPVLLR